jgi:hypothetical protein
MGGENIVVDSISSRFNVLNMPISMTAPIDAKTSNRYWAISRQKRETFFYWLPVTKSIE